MNKWRLLLLSVLCLLQSASTERDLFDGRDQYRSDTRLSIQELLRSYKNLHGLRQLNVLDQLNNGISEVELTRDPATRHYRHSEIHWQILQQDDESPLTDHRKTVEKEKFRASYGGRRDYRQRTNERNEASLLDVNRNRVLKENGDIRYSDKTRSTRSDEKRQLDNVPLRTDFNSRDRRVSNRRIEVRQIIDLRNSRVFDENRFARRELFRKNGELDYRRRELRLTKGRNIQEQLESRNRNEYRIRISQKDGNTEEIDASRSNIERQHTRGFSALNIRAEKESQENIMAIDTNNNVREKHSIDSRPPSAARFFRENQERRRNVRTDERSTSTNNLDSKRNNLNRLITDRRVGDFTVTRDKGIQSDRRLIYKAANNMDSRRNIEINEVRRTRNGREERARNEIHLMRDERAGSEGQYHKDARERVTNGMRLIRSADEESAANQIQRMNVLRNARRLLLSNEEIQERKYKNIRSTRDERINTRRGIYESSERQYLISRLPATYDIRQGRSRSLSTRRLANSSKQTKTIRDLEMENEYRNVRERIINEKRDTRNIREGRATREIHNRDAREEKQNEIRFNRNIREDIIIHEVQRTRIVRDGRRNEINTRTGERNREERASSEILYNRNVRDRGTNEIRLIRNTGEERPTNQIRQNRVVRERNTNDIRLTRNIREERATNKIRYNINVGERDINDKKLTRNSREERATNEIRHNTDVRERDTSAMRLAQNAREERATNEIRHNRNIRERDINDIRHKQNAREERATNEIRNNRNVLERDSSAIRLVRNARQENRNNRNVHERDINDIQLTRNDHEERATNEIRGNRNVRERATNEMRLTRNAGVQRVTNELRTTRDIREERTTNEIGHIRDARKEKVTNKIRPTRNTRENRLARESQDRISRERDIKESRSTRIALQEMTTNEFRIAENAHEEIAANEVRNARTRFSKNVNEEKATNELRITRNFRKVIAAPEIRHIRNAREERAVNEIRTTRCASAERSRDEIRCTRNAREERETNKIRLNRNTRDESVANQLRAIRNARENIEERATRVAIERNRNIREERDANNIRLTKNSRKERATNTRNIRKERAPTEMQGNRNTGDITNEIQLKDNAPKNEIQQIRANEIRQLRNAREARTADNIRFTRSNSEERRNIIQRRQNTRQEKDTHNINHNIRNDATINGIQHTQELKAINEIRQSTNARNARTTNDIRFTRNDREEGTNKIKKRHSNRIERLSDVNDHIRNRQELRLSNTRRVLLRDISSRRTINSDDNRKITTERKPDERNSNLQRESLYRNDEHSSVQFPASSIPVLNAELENTLVLKWQYLYYLLQGIYLCSLFMKFPKDYGESKITRAADWFATKDYLKID